MKRLWLAIVLVFASPAAADDLVSGLSQDQIQITSGYSGTDIVVFGAIENTDSKRVLSGRDIVVVVRGPSTDMTVRRKDRVAGVWVNSSHVVLHGMPAYYYVASTRRLSEIASPNVLAGYHIGLANIRAERESTSVAGKGEPYRAAVIREKEREGLYGADPQGVEFLSSTLFRVRVPVSALAPPGEYSVEVSLFRGGTIMSAQATPLFVNQEGLERQVFSMAHERPLAYGVAAVILALLFGWLSSLAFRTAQ